MISTAESSSTDDLNLLLAWPERRSRRGWLAIFAASVALHAVLFWTATKVPSLLGARRASDVQIVRHHVPLYFPRDVMTQRAPNTQKVAKQIDLADLAELRSPAGRAGERRQRTARQFEIPKQSKVTAPARNNQINLPPSVATSTDASASPSISANFPGDLKATPPPPPNEPVAKKPFEDLAPETPVNSHPTLFPPSSGVTGQVGELKETPNSRRLAISDDAPARNATPTPGGVEQAPAQHSAVELESDPNGADFKVYLRTILGIVRGNWRRVVPESARMGALRGRTVLEFVINRDGTIPKLVIADSSGHDPLDRAAVAGLSMSSLPPLPSDFKGAQIRLAFTFAYNMPTN